MRNSLLCLDVIISRKSGGTLQQLFGKSIAKPENTLPKSLIGNLAMPKSCYMICNPVRPSQKSCPSPSRGRVRPKAGFLVKNVDRMQIDVRQRGTSARASAVLSFGTVLLKNHDR